MCGRFGLFNIDDLKASFDDLVLTRVPTYNAAPTQTLAVIADEQGKPVAKEMQWGIPRKLGPDVEKNLFNTRSEKAFDRFWGKTVRTHRCLIPANGFYEWKATSDGKIPYWITPKGESLMFFAGVYDIDHEGEPHFSIMTTGPNKEMRDIHNRMPVILEGDKKYAWLEADDDTQFLEELLAPLPDGSLKLQEVSRAVNNVRNNDPQLILPVAA